MTDLFEQAGEALESDPPAQVETKRERRFAGLSLREGVLLAGAVALFIWGAWVTKNLTATEDHKPQIVQLQLQGIIGEYLQAQARSSADEQKAAQQTAAFMATLDQTVAGLSQSGTVVLVHEAVIGGDVPDVTESVRATVYAKVPRPQIAQTSLDAQQSQGARVLDEMQAFMASNGASDTGGAGNGQ